MKFSYRIVQEDEKWIAECVEVEASGDGATAAEAVMTLRDVLAERFAPQAVAPPDGEADRAAIDLKQADVTLSDAAAPRGSRRPSASLS